MRLIKNFSACAVLSLASLAAQAGEFSFEGLLADGPLAGLSFSGSYTVDTSSLTPGIDTELPLTSFSMLLGTASYTLATADFAPTAVYAQGQFVGLSYVDADSVNLTLRPQVAFVPGFDFFADAYIAYVTTPDLGGIDSGFGSYTVAVVPEPASVALWLAGLAGIAGATRSARNRRLQQNL